MSKYHAARAKYAIRLAKDLKEAADRRGSDMVIAFDGELISPKCLLIDEEKGNVYVRLSKYNYPIFCNEEDQCVGGDLTIPQYTEYFRNRFKLYMPISW
jgi:hypothetical protein